MTPDTVRLKIYITPNTYEAMCRKAKAYTKKDQITGMLEYVYHKNEMTLGSYSRDINIKLPERDKFYSSPIHQKVIIEFSIPKYVYGHNTVLVYPSQIPSVFARLCKEFVAYFGSFTYFSKWKIIRIDLCTAWKFESEEMANHIINLTRPLRYPQKRTQQYPTGVTYTGRYHGLKFYQKHAEFIANGDCKTLKQKGFTLLADEIYALSKGVVRFEIRFEDEVFMTHFKKNYLYYKDIADNEKLKAIMQTHLDTLFKFADRTAMSNQTAKEKLDSMFELNKAGEIYSIWRLLYSLDPADQEVLKKNYSRWKVYRAKKALREAGIGIPTSEENPNSSFDFSLSSPLLINQDTPLPALAGVAVGQLDILSISDK